MKHLILLIFAVIGFSNMYAQVNIFELPTSITDLSNPPDASAILDAQSTSKGMLVPRMTTTEMLAIPAPAHSLLIYNTSLNAFHYYNGSVWTNLSYPDTIQDGDGDTYISTDDGTDNDEIEVEIAGTSVLKMEYNSSNNTFGIRPQDLHGNIFLGIKAGDNNQTNGPLSEGILNTFIGAYAGQYNTTGWSNTLVGTHAGSDLTTGQYNHIFGVSAAHKLTTGEFNAVLGGGFLLETGSRNTILGHEAGYSNAAGNDNIFIGYRAGFNETTSKKLYIDYSSTSQPLIYGDFDTNELRVNGTLQVNDPSSTGYEFPISDGTANQILSTDGSGNLSWVNNSSSAGIDYYNIPYMEFYCSTGAGVYKPITPITGYTIPFASIANPDPSFENLLTAPLRLKDGATILEIVFDYIDNDAVEDLTFGIVSQDLTTGNTTIMGSLDSSTPSTSLQSLTILGTSLTTDIIDNTNKAYYVYCVPTNDPFSGWTAFQIGIVSASVKYQ